MPAFSGGILTLSLLLASPQAPDTSRLRIKGDRLLRRLERMAEFGAIPVGGVNRVAFSEQDLGAREFLIGLMQEAGLDVRVDPAGNIIGRKAGQNPELPAVVCGSHSDTVPQGGKYDGALGVIAAVECAQVLQDHGFRTRHPLEVIVFVDEEGGLIGSRALAGEITDATLEIVSHSGKTVREGIAFLGGDPDRLDEAIRHRGEIKAFIEIHVEQGKVLESRGIDIGIVEGIVGIHWWDVAIDGAANHAGTTPMDMRQDALLAAAHFIVAVNQIVRAEPGRQVGTVGRIRAEPGAPNVIPGRVRLSLELRDLSAQKIMRIFERIREQADHIASLTGTEFAFAPVDAVAVPAPTHPRIRDLIEMSARELGLSHLRMPSGAGHDAQEMARLAPIGMIFVPSVGGVSHSPREFTRASDLVQGAEVLLQTLLKIDRSPGFGDASDH